LINEIIEPMSKMVITCAVTGAETTKEDNQNLPVTPEEIAAAASDACTAGASILHLHVRNPDGSPTQDIKVFEKAISLIREKCDIVIEVTTGGAVGMTPEERLQPVTLEPELASLDCGSVNFGDDYLINTLPMIREFASAMRKHKVRPTFECFDLSHVYATHMLIKEELVEPPYHYGFVMNVPGGIRYDVDTLEFFTRKIPAGSYWTVMGIGGKAGLAAVYGAISLGGFIRVGFEDSVYYSKGVLAESNAQFVERVVRLSREAGCEIATPSDVREMFKL
jgi:3-keto-5-aminohexanoate cleavage enzyme